MQRMVMSTQSFLTPIHLKQSNLLIFPSSFNGFKEHYNYSNYGCGLATAGNSGCIVIDGPSSTLSPQIGRCLSPCCCSSSNGGEVVLDSGSTVVRKFYEGINARDLSSVENLISANCVYEDLIFPQPFVGRKAILDFFKKFIDGFSSDLQFVIDDISENDDSAVGVTWHLGILEVVKLIHAMYVWWAAEWKGKPFPFSKGCSFYKLEVVQGQRQIRYGRDSVEPAVKPGESALVAIRGVTWLLQQFPQLTDLL